MRFEMKQRERERQRNQKNENRKTETDRGRNWNCFGFFPADFIRGQSGHLGPAGETTWPVGLALPRTARKFIFCLASGLCAMGRWPLGTRTWELLYPQVNLYVGTGAWMESPETAVLGGASGRQPLSPPNLELSPSADKPVSADIGGPRVAPPGNSSRSTERQSP